jgi:hypothetical protein
LAKILGFPFCYYFVVYSVAFGSAKKNRGGGGWIHAIKGTRYYAIKEWSGKQGGANKTQNNQNSQNNYSGEGKVPQKKGGGGSG